MTALKAALEAPVNIRRLSLVLSHTLLLTRCVCRLVTASLPHYSPPLNPPPTSIMSSVPSSSGTPVDAVPPLASIHSAARALFPFSIPVSSNPEHAPTTALAGDILHSIGSCALTCLHDHPEHFLGKGGPQSLLVCFFGFYINVIQHHARTPRKQQSNDGDEMKQDAASRVVVQALNFCSGVIMCRRRTVIEASQSIQGTQAVSGLARALIVRFLPLSTAELKKWYAEPEAYLDDQNKDR